MPHWKAALRSVIRRPAFILLVVTVLAFGIAANSALFSVVNTVLLKPLPYSAPDRIVRIMESNPAKQERASLIAPPRIGDWNRLSQTFDVISASYTDSFTDTSMAEPERLAGHCTAPDYFAVFGMRPLIGRTFSPNEEKFGGPHAAVISEALWTRRYQRDPKILNRRLMISGSAYTIVGVMPREFASPAIDLWLPAQFGQYLLQNREARFLRGVGRMKSGVTLDQARADLARVSQRLGEQYPKTDKGWSALVEDYKQWLIGKDNSALALMFGAVALLLLILCANIAGLLLAQFQRRERELAIRSSLGATRTEIGAVVLREVAILAVLSGTLGVALAFAGVHVLSRIFATLPRIQELHLDWRIAVFTWLITAATAFIFGMIPAFQAVRRNLNPLLSQGSRTQAGGRHPIQRILVAAQFSVTLVLLAGAGLLLRSYYNLTRVQPGFRAEQVITFHLGAGWGEDRKKIGLLQQELLSELERLPEVEAAGLTNFLPASEATLREQVTVAGLGGKNSQEKITTGTRSVTAGYLRALQVPLLQGSTCPAFRIDGNSQPNGQLKALVNKRFAEVAGSSDLIGHRLALESQSSFGGEIIGIVGDVKEDSLRAPLVPYVYFCIPPGGWPDPEYVVATSGGQGQLMRAVRNLAHRIAPQRAVFGMSTLADQIDRTLEKPRLNAGLLGVFAVSALLFSALGLYGLLILMVTARTKEIGVRMALGARPAQIIRQVMNEALRPLVFAILIGATAAFFILRLLRSILFEIAPTDILTFAAVCLLLMAVAAVASLIPSRRAAKIDPMEALRSE